MMNILKEAHVLYNAKGKKTHVLLPFNSYKKLLEYLEDFEDIRAMKEVGHEPDVPFDDVKRRLAKKER